jgi:Fe-S cluster biogenesis protein NfuA
MENKEDLLRRINLALDEIRPFLKSDGGDISLVEVDEEGVVLVQLHGACIGCSVKKHAPEVVKVNEVSMMPK